MSASPELGMNERAWALADRCEQRAADLRVHARQLASGSRVIDAGIDVPGGYDAGLVLADICMGGLGHVAYAPITIDGETWPGLQVWTDHPAVSCMASQYAGWIVNPPGFFGMGSGPLRAKARVERDLFARLGYGEDGSRGVLVLETRTFPSDEVAVWLAAKAGIDAKSLTIVVAPTASLAGGTQIAARVLETGLHKMDMLGFDVTRVVSGIGTAPLPPTARTDVEAIGRTNDCILYGGQARYLVRASDDELAELVPRLPACASPDYGAPFRRIFERSGGDFYKIDRMLFSPAEVWLTGAASGRTFHGGRLNPGVLHASLFED